MTNNQNTPSPQDANKALNSVAEMQQAGWRRAIPSRGFGAGIALFIACLFALYALQDPYPYILIPILGLTVFITTTTEHSGAYRRENFRTKYSVLGFFLFAGILLMLFFGAISIRRTYDIAWVPVVAGIVAGLMLFFGNESLRRATEAKASGKPTITPKN